MRVSRRLGRAGGALLWAAVAGVLTPAAASAAEGLPGGGWQQLTVGVLPVRYYGRVGADLFDERPAVRRAREAAGRWQRLLEATLANRDQLRVMRAEVLTQRLTQGRDYRRTSRLAARYAQLGLTRYHDLQAAEGLGELDRARELYREVFADVAEPDAVADVALYRGLVLAELGDPGRAHVAFRETLYLDASRRFEPGYYPPDVENALTGAQADIYGQLNKLANRWPIDRLEGLAKALGVEILVTALLDGPPDALVLRVAVYDRRLRSIASSDRVSLADPELAADRLDRLVAAWSTCAVEADREQRLKAPQRERWFVDLGYSHGLWLIHKRTRDFIQSVGGQVAVTYEPTSALQLYFRGMQVATLPDGNGDLLDVFVTSRFAFGAGLTLGSPTLRVFARTGLELGLSTSGIGMTTDVDCKHFGAAHARCSSVFTAGAPAIWFGAEFALGARVKLSRGWYLAITTAVSSYVLSPDIIGELNFPLDGSVGLGASF